MDIKKALIALPLLGIGLLPATSAWAHPYSQTSNTTTTTVDSSDSAHCVTPTNDDTQTDSSSASNDTFAGLCTDLKIEKKAGSIDWDGKTVEWEMTVTNLGPDDVPEEQAIVVTDNELTFSNFGLKVGEHFTVTLYPHNFVTETCNQTNTASVALAEIPKQKGEQEIAPAVVIDGNMKNNTSTASFDSCTEATTTTTSTTTTSTTTTSPTTSSTPEATTTQPAIGGTTSSTTGSSVAPTTQSTSTPTNTQATTTASGASTQATSLSGTDVKSAVNTRSRNLPFTGANSSTFAAIALGLIGIGMSILFAAKRRSR